MSPTPDRHDDTGALGRRMATMTGRFRNALIHACAAVVVALIVSTGAFAESVDTVHLTIEGGYPVPFRSQERLRLELVRIPAVEPRDESRVDRTFERIDQILESCRLPDDWTLRVVDAPFVDIAIERSGKRTRLSASTMRFPRTTDPSAPTCTPDQDERARGLAATGAILDAVLEHASEAAGLKLV